MKKILVLLFIVILVSISLVGGCGKSQAANAKIPLSNEHAAKIIIADLQHHQESFQSVKVEKIAVNSSGNAASVQYTITLPNGKKQAEIATMVIDHGVWCIQGHKH